MSTPASLYPKSESSTSRVEAWVLSHANLLMPLSILILLLLFCGLCYAIMGVSAVESGNYYNHLQGVI